MFDNMTCLLFSLLNNLMLLADDNAPTVTEGKGLLKDTMDLMVKFTNIGGGLWLAWGLVVLAGGLKDKNGPALQSGIWQMVGGGLIMIGGNIILKIIS